MYDFDKIVDRKGTNCEKWDIISRDYNDDAITPMWVADMDFEVAPAIINDMQEILDRKLFGYGQIPNHYYTAIINWMERRHQYTIEKDWICPVPNVVNALALSVCAVSKPNDEIIIQTPVYGPFYRVVTEQKRILIENPLKNNDGHYRMDLIDLEKKITSKTKAIILCNPHNPCGRVWSKEELIALTNICLKHNLYIISDDIHFDLILKGTQHTVISTLSEEIANQCIICTSPSKPFNLAGLHLGNCIIKNKSLREKFQTLLYHINFESGNVFAESALIAAYDKSEDWLDQLLLYLDENINYFVHEINHSIPFLKAKKPEGTYLVWVDCSQLSMTQEELMDFFIHTCKVLVVDGLFFGIDGANHVRFNLACPRSLICSVLKRIQSAINSINVN